MQQNRSITNCKYHSQPNNLIIKNQATFVLQCPICYIQCIKNIQDRHKQLTLTEQVAKPIILNEQSKLFFIEWSQQLIKILTNASLSNYSLEYITNYIFLSSQTPTLLRTYKQQLSKMFIDVLVNQKDILKGNIQYIRDLSPNELSVELFLADLYNMVAKKAESSLLIIIDRFKDSLFHFFTRRGYKNVELIQKIQFNINFSQQLIQSKQKIISKYQSHIFYDVMSILILRNEKIHNIQKQNFNISKSYSESQESQCHESELKYSQVIQRKIVVGENKGLQQKTITIEVQSPIKKIVSQIQTPKNKSTTSLIDKINIQQSVRMKSKESTAQTKKKQKNIQRQLDRRIISQQNQISSDLQNSRQLDNKNFIYSNHSENIEKLSKIIENLSIENKKLRNWKEGFVDQTANFNNKIKQVSEWVKLLRETDIKQKQMPDVLETSEDDEQKMINLLIQQYQQLQSKYESIIEQLMEKNKQKDLAKNENNFLKEQMESLRQTLSENNRKNGQRVEQKQEEIKILKQKIQQLDDRIRKENEKINSLRKQSEILNIKISYQEDEKFKNTLRQLEEATNINSQYLAIMKQKANIIDQMQQKHQKQIQTIREHFENRLAEKQKSWQLSIEKLHQINSEIAKQLQYIKQHNRQYEEQKQEEDKERQKNDKNADNQQVLSKEISSLKRQLKIQRQKLEQAAQITRQLANLGKEKQAEIDELKIKLQKSITEIQQLSNDLSKAEELIKQLSKGQNQQLCEIQPTSIKQAKQSENLCFIINTEKQEKDSLFDEKQSMSEMQQRIGSLERKVMELEQELKNQSVSYNDSLIQDLIETESQVKAKQFQINKFINLIEEILSEVPESQRKKYLLKLSQLHP